MEQRALAPSPGWERGGVAAWPARGSRPLPTGPPWQPRWVAALVGLDGLAVAAALVTGFVVRFGVEPAQTVGGIPYLVVGALIGVGWLLGLGTVGGYEARHLGVGPEEYKRVAVGTFRVWGLVAIACYAGKVEVARGFVVVALPLGLVLLVAGRGLMRRRLVRARRQGRSLHRVLVVGDPRSVAGLAGQLHRERAAGFDVVGACVPGGSAPARAGDLPVLGSLADVPAAARRCGADTVAVASTSAVSAETVRRIAWGLEGAGVDLMVAPSVMDVAGPRVSVRPVAGLPLLHVDQPEFTGARRLTKAVLDRVLAGLVLVALAPILLAVAGLIRLTSPGPAVFRQARIGRNGREFQVAKFRTMYADAEHLLGGLAARNETDGLFFKIEHDPRVTPLGRFLRRTSVDELPQLLNVLRGDMALVGPRPLPVKDSDFTGDIRRRLLVRPGITGLWQVNGRSRLSWEDAVRLDLYYVENWSISLDVAILLRTAGAVLRGTGAY